MNQHLRDSELTEREQIAFGAATEQFLEVLRLLPHRPTVVATECFHLAVVARAFNPDWITEEVRAIPDYPEWCEGVRHEVRALIIRRFEERYLENFRKNC